MKLEAEAVLLLIRRFFLKDDTRITSDAIYAELDRNKDIIKKDKIWNLFKAPHMKVPISQKCYDLAVRLHRQGVRPVDALHVAIAETDLCDFFLTTDDQYMTPEEIRKEGMKALQERLGVEGMIRFIMLFDRGLEIIQRKGKNGWIN